MFQINVLIRINFFLLSVAKCSKFSVCDVCYFLKQKRLSFPFSTSKSKKYFDLIHVDL